MKIPSLQQIVREDGFTMKARSPAHVDLAPEAVPLTWANLQAVSIEAALLFAASIASIDVMQYCTLVPSQQMGCLRTDANHSRVYESCANASDSRFAQSPVYSTHPSCSNIPGESVQ